MLFTLAAHIHCHFSHLTFHLIWLPYPLFLLIFLSFCSSFQFISILIYHKNQIEQIKSFFFFSYFLCFQLVTSPLKSGEFASLCFVYYCKNSYSFCSTIRFELTFYQFLFVSFFFESIFLCSAFALLCAIFKCPCAGVCHTLSQPNTHIHDLSLSYEHNELFIHLNKSRPPATITINSPPISMCRKPRRLHRMSDNLFFEI